MSNNKALIAIAIVVAGVLVAGAVIFNSVHSSSPQSGTAPSVAVDISKVSTAGEPFIGNVNAPVTMALWTDYQCPYCQAFEVGNPQVATPAAMPDIVKNYVDTGKVKIVFKDYQFLGPDSMVGAEWARAVWNLYPSQYFAWRTAIYTNQPQENSLSASAYLAWLKKTTGSVNGIDAAKVEAAATANKAAYDAEIDADKAEGASFGIQATPSFIIGKQMIAGAYPYAQFQQALDAQLAGK